MALPDPRIKVHKIRGKMSIGQTPNRAKFCGDPTRSVRDIPDRKFVLPEESGPKYTEIFQWMLLTEAPKQPKFCRSRLKNVGEIRDQKSVLQKVD